MADPINMRVVDSDLGDKVHDAGPYDFVVPNTLMMKDVVAQIRGRAGCNPINSLTLICHGRNAFVYGDTELEGDTEWTRGQTVVLPGRTRSDASESICRTYGGYGLVLGKEDLNLKSVCSFGGLRGAFRRDSKGVIIIFGCAAADTGPTYTDRSGQTLSGDGPRLMRTLASHTRASVIAAVTIQRAYQNWYLKTADRIAFNGDTYFFTLDGRQIRNPAACY